MELKTELKLKKKIKQLERRIIDLVWPDKSDSIYGSVEDLVFADSKSNEKLDDLLRERKFCLNKLFRGTDLEYDRLEMVNNTLREHTIRLDSMVSDLYKSLNNLNLNWLGNLCVEGEMTLPTFDVEYDILPDDIYYGSEFNTIINIECAYCIAENSNRIHDIVRAELREDVNFKASELDMEIDDWKEGIFYYMDKQRYIKWCYALHHLEDHLFFPLADIIHLKEFALSVKSEAEHIVKVK